MLKYFVYLFVSNQLKKTTEELHEALSAKEEIAQRCHELDMQVRGLLSLQPHVLYIATV
jgi:hypothetical protein